MRTAWIDGCSVSSSTLRSTLAQQLQDPAGFTLTLTDELVQTFDLVRWAEQFSLMTAGFRERLDPDDAFNPLVPFNAVTVLIMAEAKAQLFMEEAARGVHVGGEVRAHTPLFIDLLSRVYAAHNYPVFLRPDGETTPIWYSSFGIAYEALACGDNFTASHSSSGSATRPSGTCCMTQSSHSGLFFAQMVLSSVIVAPGRRVFTLIP